MALTPTSVTTEPRAERSIVSKNVGMEEHSGATVDSSLFQQKRRDILAGAARVFDRRGFSAGTTKEIAGEVGLSQPAIYHYVGSKDDLLGEIAQQVARDMLAALEAGLSQGDEPYGQFRAVIREFTAAVLKNQVEFSVFWKELNSFPATVRASIDEGERYFIAELARLVGELQKAGHLPPTLPQSVITEAVSGMVCWTYRWYRPGLTLDAEALAEMFLTLIGLPAVGVTSDAQ